jgi:DNA repair photolyase
MGPRPPDRTPPGRGAGFDPPNRFEALRYEAEAPEDVGLEPEEIVAPRTRFLRDPARSIVATNQSPDVGFDASVNPYRGCEHGCVYCTSPDTPVLGADMVWRPIGGLRIGDELVAFDEFPPAAGHPRKLRRARVEEIRWSWKPTRRLITRNAEVVTTAEHLWLQDRNFRWSRTDQLAPGRRLRHMPVVGRERIDDDYRIGYVAGMTLGDGTFRYQPGWRGGKGFPVAYWRVALADMEPLERLRAYLRCLDVDVAIRPFSSGSPLTRKPMWRVETRSLTRLEIIYKLIVGERSTRGYQRGFLAGFFDAEGHNGDSLRISQVDLDVLERARRYGRAVGFDLRLEHRHGGASTIRLIGSVLERIRWFSVLEPAIARKREAIFGTMPTLDPEPIEAIEPGPVRDVVDIQTSTGTFYAAGLATHNCYARPTHEYLGFSAGLDFETRILVKEEAPALLRRTLAARAWRPQVVALSGVTDPYQPIERRLGLTRRCLEVLLEFRNPVAVVTKSRLVVRDADLLAELARLECASVAVSVTTLDAALARRMEPRAPRPDLRLEAIERLAAAGVPVGVMVAPIVPGLTEHEIPAILEAAARAGASFAGRVVLRLPHAVKELVDEWLARHHPERRNKVLNRMRALRGGRLYDPRFGVRQRGEGVFAEQIEQLFETARRRAGIADAGPRLSTAHFRRPDDAPQLALF